MIIVEFKEDIEIIRHKCPDAIIADVTEETNDVWGRLSPYYPHGGILVPNSGNITATSIEAIWQGLKVFENSDIDINLFENYAISGFKRTAQEYGRMLGHRFGVNGEVLLDYRDALRRILFPVYRWVFDYDVHNIIEGLRKNNDSKTIVLLDYSTNCDLNNITKPISCAYLVKAYTEGLPPYEDTFVIVKRWHYYSGKRFISWFTEERVPKKVGERPILSNSRQLEIPFDFFEC